MEAAALEAAAVAVAMAAGAAPARRWAAAQGARPPSAPVCAALAAGAGLWAAAALSGPPLWAAAPLGLALGSLAAVDAAVWRLPDALTLPLTAAGLALSLAGLTGALAAHAAAAALGYGAVWALSRLWLRLRGVEGMGLGDAKLLAAAGAWCGPAALPTLVLAACALGLAAALAAAARAGRLDATAAAPFGPALAAAFWLIWVHAGPAAA